MSKKRDKLMPMMSIIGIVLVVLGHSGYAGTNIAEDCPYFLSGYTIFTCPCSSLFQGFFFH